MTALKRICIILLFVCASCGDDTDSNTKGVNEYKSQVVMDEIDRFNAAYPEYAITIQSEIETEELIIPENLDDVGGWSIVNAICEEGGYGITGYTGETVFLSEYDIGEDCGELKLNLIAISNGNSCPCLYMLEVHEDEYTFSYPGIDTIFRRCGG